MSGLALTRQRPANFALLYIVQQDEAAAANYFVVVLGIKQWALFYFKRKPYIPRVAVEICLQEKTINFI